MTNKIIRGDVLRGLAHLPDRSVHCVITSPPYWGLRDYGVEGQIGLESTPEEYLARMVAVFREVKRVLRDDGTVWLNMGDCYNSSPSNSGDSNLGNAEALAQIGRLKRDVSGLKPKDLVGMPWRLAFALQADGWWLRSDIIWSKPNPMPESVADRPTKSHEYLFLLAKEARYFYDADAIREPVKPETLVREKYGWNPANCGSREWHQENSLHSPPSSVQLNPAGRNRRTVWEIPTQPFPGSHFATFPEALVEPCIKAGTSERGCCPTCGAPWERQVDTNYVINSRTGGSNNKWHRETANTLSKISITKMDKINTTIGWSPTCTHTADPIPCTVLDPFAGSGTVAKVARDLNRSSIGIELNAGYVEIIKRRLRLNEQLVKEYEVVEVST